VSGENTTQNTSDVHLMLLIILSAGIMTAKLCAVPYLRTLKIAEYIALVIDE
jgi:hypothetical protein